MRILIEVEGRMVQDIYLDYTEGDLEIYVLDKDNQEVGEQALSQMDWTNQTRWAFDTMIKEAEIIDANPYDEEIP